MSSDWESFFRKAERERQEAERRRREEAERQRQLAEQRRKASIQRAINQFDREIKSLLRGYAAAKMRGTARVLSPDPDSSSPTWRLECSGYVGVRVTLRLRPTSSGEREPDGFSISGTNGGHTQAGPSVSDLANALAPSVPTVYVPPTCRCDTYTFCSCDSEGGLTFGVCP